MSYSRLVVGDRFGTVIAELQPDIEFVNWRLNKIGQTKFRISTTDPKAISTILQYANRVLIEFENGLPDWGGVIYPSRTWDKKIITATVYSPEYLFKYRTTDKGRYFTNQTVGEIFTALINEANAIEDTGISVGEVWGGGIVHSPDYHFKRILDIFQKSLTKRLSTADFAILPSLIDGKITFTANLYDSRGANKSGLALIQGKNLSRVKLVEQGPIINSWDVAGEGTGWGDARLTANASNINSMNLYGLREDSRVYSDVSTQGTLDENAENLLSESGNPFNIYTLETADIEPTKFAAYDIGDMVSLLAHDYGFGGTKTTIRILAREFSPQTGKCSLVVQEIIDD